jgi:hypothetical protein
MVCEHEYMNSICTLPQLLRLVMALTPPNHNANNFEIKSPDDETSGFKIMHYNIYKLFIAMSMYIVNTKVF